MDEMNQQQFDELLNKIGRLAEQQDQLQREISNLKDSIYQLRNKPAVETKPETREVHPKKTEQFLEPPNLTASKEKQKAVNIPPFRSNKEKTPIEEFIGTNLLNKIGIIILVLGISYGVKYSIDHNLIDPI